MSDLPLSDGPLLVALLDTQRGILDELRLLNRRIGGTVSLGPANDLESERARKALAATSGLLSRKAAAEWLGVDPRTFDKLAEKHGFRDLGLPGSPRYSQIELEKWLENQPAPGRSESNPAARTGSSGSRIKATISRNPRAQAMVLRLSGSPKHSTEK